MKSLISLLLILSLLTPAHAEDTVVLKKGEPATFDGFLIDRPKAEKYRLLQLDLDFANKIDEQRVKETNILQKRVENLNTELNNMSSRLVDAQDNSFWGKLGMFILGAGVASLVAYGAARSVR